MCDTNIKEGHMAGLLIRLKLSTVLLWDNILIFLNRAIEIWKLIWYAKCIKNTVKEDTHAY